RWKSQLESLPVDGIPLTPSGRPARPGVVSLQDAYMAADDWLILRSARRTVRDLIAQYGLGSILPIEQRKPPVRWRLVIPAQSGEGWVFRVYDESRHQSGDLRPTSWRGYITRGGVELLGGGIFSAGMNPAAR